MAGKYTATTTATILTTELDSLADGSNKISAALSNDAITERDFIINLQLDLAATATRTGKNVDVYILPELDGVYVSGSDSVDPESKHYVGSFMFDLTTAAKVDEIQDIRLPNADYKILLQNNLGVAFAVSGTTLKSEVFGYEDV